MPITFREFRHHLACMASLSLVLLASASQAETVGFQKGTPEIKHAGSLAFGPEGVLLIGDSVSASVFAIETGDNGGTRSASEINIAGLNRKIADMVGSDVSEVSINDLAVNPASGNIYLSVSRGRGPDAAALLFKVDGKGEIAEFATKDVSFAKAQFENAATGKDRRGRSLRMSAITDVQFSNGKVIVAGLSNEEFASKLRVFDYPFAGDDSATSIEVFHGAHGRLETNSPVRTFITYENTVLAAYTCTPLVTIPIDDLDGKKVRGKTVAELGNRNNPLDMIVYRKGEQDFLLLSNTARGVMKMKLSKQDLDSVDSIESRISGGGTAGLKYETMDQFQNVVQLDKLSDEHAIMLVASSGNALDLKTVALP